MRAPETRQRLRDTVEALTPRAERAETAMKPHVNRAVLILGLAYPISMAPQLYNVWALHRTAGLSELTYAAGLAMALTWMLYGLVHRDRTVFGLNILWIGVHTSMIVGLMH